MQDHGTVDLLVVGGGANGAGMARDAAGRGLSVLLCEKDDLAEGTSSRSSKLVHGGLRYLEHREFRLVREALSEREVLLNAAPHIVWPIRFVIPHSPEQRPRWMIRLGLFLYDHLGRRKRLPATRSLDLRTAPEGAIIRDRFAKAFEYSDCWVDDARLVVLNALDAKERGATILTRTEAVSAERRDGLWHVGLRGADGETALVQARCLANAAGPWVETVIRTVARQNSSRHVRLVKGSHIVTRKFWDGPQAYVLQNTDRRLIFVIPYLDDLALIGTTEVPIEGRVEDVSADEREIAYLLEAVGRFVEKPPTRRDVLHTYAGVRPLIEDESDDPSAVTRDYLFEVEAADGKAPLLNIFGGKITTYRELAERGLERLRPFLPAMKPGWTAGQPLPGGDMADGDFDAFLAAFKARYSWLPAPLATHYARLYGTRADRLLGGATGMTDLGRPFGALLYEAEVRYLIGQEWARTADDVLERRTKHARTMSRDEIEVFSRWMVEATARPVGA